MREWVIRIFATENFKFYFYEAETQKLLAFTEAQNAAPIRYDVAQGLAGLSVKHDKVCYEKMFKKNNDAYYYFLKNTGNVC